MKINFSKWLIALCVAVSFVAAASSAEAYQCKWVRAYHQNGVYHPAHKVCWHNHRVRHCGWRNGQKVCWYN